jgi:deoxyribodipyrimidine photo-lyase
MPDSPLQFLPGRAEGLARLADFLPRAGFAYAEGRNRDAGPGHVQPTSALSPWLRHRILTEREVIAAVLDVHGHPAADKFIQEVLWRTYWKGWLQMRPGVWSRFTRDRDAARFAGGGMARAVAAAEAGGTGIEGFDDWAHELVGTGWLHNHARMSFASIWIFTLGLPWTLGADFFLRHLIDADPASNTLSWRWVAGLQTVGKTYLASADAIARCTGGRFRPRGLATEARALTEPAIDAPRPLAAAVGTAPDRPWLLLVTSEDLNPESLFGAGRRPVGIVMVENADDTASRPRGEAALRFVAGASADAVVRCESDFGVPCQTVAGLTPGAVADHARRTGADVVVTAEVPVGPVADALDRLEAGLFAEGLALTRVRRSWDARLWPLAGKGFFPFRQKAPHALAAEGLPI